MKVKLLQQDIVWANSLANQETASIVISEAGKADLYVLPEMWSTGFATVPEGIAEEDCCSLNWMIAKAKETQAAIAGSVATKAEDGSFRNRFYFVKPDGSYQYYDKRHLFTYGGEHKLYTAGSERVVVEYLGVKFLLLVCYDLRFPIWARNSALKDEEYPGAEYDAIIYVASWPTPRVEAWRALLRARAIENQCYVLGVNRVGVDPSCQYSGGTAFIDPYGKTVEECPSGEVAIASGEIDLDKLNGFREKFPVLKDRD